SRRSGSGRSHPPDGRTRGEGRSAGEAVAGRRRTKRAGVPSSPRSGLRSALQSQYQRGGRASALLRRMPAVPNLLGEIGAFRPAEPELREEGGGRRRVQG